MSTREIWSVFKPLEKFPEKPKLTYVLEKEKEQYWLTVNTDRKYNSLREVAREQLTVPEQLLLNILVHQPIKDDRIQLQKDVLEKCLFFLQELGVKIDPLPQGEFELTYLVEMSRTYARINIDFSVTGVTSLRDVPRDRLSLFDRMFLGFLAGVPINGGSFYAGPHLLAKVLFFLARVKTLDKATGKPVCTAKEDFLFDLYLQLTDRGYELSILQGEKQIDLSKLYLIGDKQFIVSYQDCLYPLRYFDYFLLSCFNGQNLILPEDQVPEFLADWLPILKENINCRFSAEIQEFEARVIGRSPVPVLDIQTEKKTIRATLKFDYGLAEPINYVPGLDTFYVVEQNGAKYFLKRDKKSEAWLEQYLEEKRFELAKGAYKIAEDDFIDFFTYDYPGLKKTIGLKIIGADLDKFKFSGAEDFEIDVDFREVSGIDWFEFSPNYKIKNKTFTHAEIGEMLADEKEYIRLEDGTLVKIPTDQYEYLQKYLENRKADTKTGKYKIKKYDIYYLYTGLRTQLKSKVDDSLQTLLNKLDNFEGIPSVAIPKGIKGEPRHYQHSGFNWMAFLNDNAFHGILADDMGLGKTLQVLMLFKYLKENGKLKEPALIVAPTSVVYNWVNEIQKFTPELKVLVLSGSKDRLLKVKEAKDYDILITSYALLRNDLDHYSKLNFSYMVIDEAQAIKNPKSQIAQTVKCVSSAYRLALTGTPVENRLSELWSIFDFLMPGFLGTLNYFRGVYEDDAERLKAKIKPFIIRRTKAEVLTELPPKNEIDSFCELLPDQEQAYLTILQAQKKEIFSLLKTQDVGKIQLNILASLLRLRQICCHPALLGGKVVTNESAKFNQFKELLEEIREGGNKVIVFSQFVQMLTIMRHYIEQEKIKYSYLDGSTKDRQAVIDDFNKDTEKQVFLCSLKAGGLGINLTSANYVIIYDPWWNPAVEQQAMDRVYRIGQSKEVFVYKLITKGTVEEKIMKLQAKKKQLINEVIISEEPTKKITKEDLEDLFTY